MKKYGVQTLNLDKLQMLCRHTGRNLKNCHEYNCVSNQVWVCIARKSTVSLIYVWTPADVSMFWCCKTRLTFPA